MTPGRKLSMTTSAWPMSSFSSPTPSGRFRLSVIDRVLRFTSMKRGEASGLSP